MCGKKLKVKTGVATETPVSLYCTKPFTHHQSEQDSRLERTCLECQFVLRYSENGKKKMLSL